MKLISVVQGSQAWHEHRANNRNASEASSVMSASKYVTRTQLFDIKKTGIDTRDNQWAEAYLWPKGHEIEAAARPIAEELIGEELYPVIGVSDDGYLSASFDGLTLLEDTAWECKSWNEEKAEAVRNKQVPKTDYWQVVQQLEASDGTIKRLLYMVTDGTREKTVSVWVEPDPGAGKKLRAGWAQFDDDLSAHVVKQPEEAKTGTAPSAMPILHIELQGQVTSSNLDAFKQGARDVLSKINTDLQTDQDFADAESTVKWAKEVESKLDAAKDYALSQTADIAELFRVIDEVREETRSKRLDLDKLVKARKKARKLEIAQAANDQIAEHIKALHAGLDGLTLPLVPVDLNGAMKGKRTVSSLQSAADDEVARVKIESSAIAERMRANIATISAAGYDSLFHDRNTLALKEPDDLAAVIKTRIAEHEAELERRREVEREQERLRKEREAEAERQRLEREAAIESQRQEREAEKSLAQAAQSSQEELATPGDDARTPVTHADSQPSHSADESVTEGLSRSVNTSRPSDNAIVSVLATHFRTDDATVLAWLASMDLKSLYRELIEEFA